MQETDGRACHSCNASPLSLIPEYRELSRVTSDCRSWPAGGTLAVCSHCGLVQHILDEEWHREAEDIYREYAIYHQGGGAEQPVFSGEFNAPTPRSARIAEFLTHQQRLPDAGRMLDIGCGNGAFLRAFAAVRPSWRLIGTEVNDKYRATVESIPGVERLHTGGLDELSGRFDVVSMVHVLEHIPHPQALLASLSAKLSTDGLLVIQVPYFIENPFDLVIADHCSHFTPETLRDVLSRAGFEAVSVTTSCVTKEITAIARVSNAGAPPAEPLEALSVARSRASWLRHVRSAMLGLSDDRETGRPLGLFGTSIAATWLFRECGGRIDFFVDEDPNRIGTAYLERPVLGIESVPADAVVFLGLAPTVAAKLGQRIGTLGFAPVQPPPLDN